MHALHFTPPSVYGAACGRAVLLDRDGTINVERHYLSHPDELELLPGAAAGLRALRDMGLRLLVVTNQSAVGRGMFDLARLDAIHRRLEAMLRAEGVELDAVYACPHLPDAACACRKPLPGLARAAAADYGLDLASSFAIGDKACDVDLGRAIGAQALLVLTGHGAAAAASQPRADAIVADLLAAAEHIRSVPRHAA